MKANRKVIDSILVAALTVALSVTAVTTNRVSETENTQLDTNGIAGVAVAVNEYGMEAADYLDDYISVEKEQVTLVASAVDSVAKETPDTDTEKKEEKTLSPEEEEWQDKLMADVKESLNVREKPDENSAVVGKMKKGDRAVIKETGSEWTKIESGNVKGYVKNAYCVTGQKALEYAKKNCDKVAKVKSDGLRIRKKASTDAGVIKTAAKGDYLTVDKKAKKQDGWVAVKAGSSTGYVSAEYVTVSLKTGKAITIEEEQAALKAEQEKKEKEAREAAAKKSQKSSGQKISSGNSRGTSLAASADEETLLAALVQCEAGGCGVECMTAVAAVVVNRVHSGSYPSSIYNVIYQRGQFGPASSGRLESRLASGVSSSARQAARAALGGSDPTGGARSFKLASSGHAGVVIGPIVFF